jgi:hypothetical protein
MDQKTVDNFAIVRDAPGRLKAALKGVPRKLLLWTPAPGKWSILEIVCHMRDMEQEAYIDRYRRILAEDNPSLPDIDGEQYAILRNYRGQKLPEVLKDWLRLRRECIALLKTVHGDAWQREGQHDVVGALSMERQLMRQARGNDEAHIGQIEAIRSRFAILTSLEAGPKALKQATKDLSEDELLRQLAPGKWSILEIVCHLRDTERQFGERFSKMAFQDRPTLWMMDNDRVAQALRYREAKLSEALAEFERLRGDSLTLLRALPAPLWSRTALHPTRGEVTIEALARVLAAHDPSHLERIRAQRG